MMVAVLYLLSFGLLVLPTRAQVKLGSQGAFWMFSQANIIGLYYYTILLYISDCQVRTDNWNKDYKFDAYKKETGAAFSNFEIRSLSGSDDTLKVISNVKNVLTCFKSCVDTKECGTFTYVAKSKRCTLSSERALASDKTSGNLLARFCRKKGSIAGYVGYSVGSDENKQEKEKVSCTIDYCIKQCCGDASGTCNIKGIKCTSKGAECLCWHTALHCNPYFLLLIGQCIENIFKVCFKDVWWSNHGTKMCK